MDSPSGQVPCSYHPHILTGLRCTRCGKPICPLDAVRTPVGLRCPDCAGVRSMGTIPTDSTVLVKSALGGIAVAIAVAILWRFAPGWQFYLSLALGFGVAETIANLSGNKRGRDLQLVALLAITIGFLLSRYLLAQRYGISFDQIRDFSTFVSRRLQLQAIPDLLFIVIAYVIGWVRFK